MSERDDIPKSIWNRFRNLDFEDDPSPPPEPTPPKAPEPTEAKAPPEPRRPPAPSQPPARRTPRVPTPPRIGPQPGFHTTRMQMRPAPPDDPRGRGVIIEEATWERVPGQGASRVTPPPPPPRRPAPAPGVHGGWPSRRDSEPPVTLSAEAARRLRLMAHRAGCEGWGLRIIASRSGKLVDCDFAFEDLAHPEDVVVETQGMRVYLDRASFDVLKGTHLTYEDVPGLEGFRLARPPGQS